MIFASRLAFWAFAEHSYNGADIMVLASCPPSIPICRERVVSVHRQAADTACVLANGTNVLVYPLLARHTGVGDEITFPISPGDKSGVEIYITKSSASPELNRCLYQAPIRYVTQPKLDERNQLFVSAEVQEKALAISAILLPCATLRDYFYRLPSGAAKDAETTFYEILHIPPSASPAELRLAYRLRILELGTGSRSEQLILEKAFNIIGQQPIRERVGDERLHWLKTLPAMHSGEGFAVVHASSKDL